MSKQWIPAIFDRTYGDVEDVRYTPTLVEPKGAWNAVDLNRIENNTQYCIDYMLEHRIYRTDPGLTVRDNDYWQPNMIPHNNEVRRIINNVVSMVTYCKSVNPAIADKLPTIYAATQMNFNIANDIERALDLMHNQPDIPLEYFALTITNGIIKQIQRADGTIEIINNNTALIAEDEVATIRGVEYGPDAQYQVFTLWSGDAEDIQYLDNYMDQETTYLGQYRDVEFTANFQTKIPRLLQLTNGYISVTGNPRAESGPDHGTYFAGDEIMIIANVAPSGKAFYEWLGTQEGLDNLTGASETDPSTCILVMPDCDVSLSPRYINAGQHYVQVTNGHSYGESGDNGWYNYNEYVTISADVPSHYGFDNWSGPDTAYLEDLTSSYQSFRMPDVNVSFRANYSYRYSYNDVQVINGKIMNNGNAVSSATGLQQSSSYTLVPEPPDNTYGVDYWQVEGYGSVSGNTFTVGDGNAIITGHYAKNRTLTVHNINNGGSTDTYTIVEGHTKNLSTNSRVGNNRFVRWEENGQSISTSTSIAITMSTADRDITAVYEVIPEYTLTQINKNNNGGTTQTTYSSGTYITVSSTEIVGNYILEGIYKDGNRVTTSTSYNFTINTNVTIEFRYRERQSYTLSVLNGHIVSTGESSGTFLEREQVQVVGDDPVQGASFTGWSVTSGSLYSYSQSKTMTLTMGYTNATIRANYQNLRDITVVTESGTSTYTILQGNSRQIVANPAPNTYEFDYWECTSGDATFANYLSQSTYVYANTQNSTVVAHYKAIPYFTITMQDGYIWDGTDWVTSATLLRNSTNAIKMKPAPTGQQFFQWEVYVNGVLQTNANDVLQPLAETTSLRNLLRDATLKATYYTPGDETTYTLTIKRIDGSVDEYHNTVGYQQQISASLPAQGMQFKIWKGDTAYLVGGIRNPNNVVNTPATNIYLEETYEPEGTVTKYHLYMVSNCECKYTTEYTDPDTGTVTTQDWWVTDHEYEAGEVVDIRTKNIPFGWRFTSWSCVDDEIPANDLSQYITHLHQEATTITIIDTDMYVTAGTVETEKYDMTIIDGGTDGSYYEDWPVDIYFDKTNTNDIHYDFIRWNTGSGSEIDISQLKLQGGGMFQVLTPGTSANPQIVLMPAKDVVIQASYRTKYKFYITNGTIDSQDTYFVPGTLLNITADTAPSGMTFQRWDGDTQNIANIYDPTTTITTVQGITRIFPVYSTDADRNGIGYVLTDLSDSNIINNNDIIKYDQNMTLGNGFIITDTKGHIYIISSYGEPTSSILRMTKISKGGDVYE